MFASDMPALSAGGRRGERHDPSLLPMSDVEIEPAAVGTDDGVGARLREARLARGMSIDDVAAATRVRARHLVAIEAGDMAPLPTGPYSIGFVKSYARLVGLDPVATSEAFRVERDAAELPREGTWAGSAG